MQTSDFVSILNRVVPKRNIIVFNSFPDLSGNALALYKYIYQNRKDICAKYKLIWTITELDDEKVRKILNKKVGSGKHNIIAKKSPVGLTAYLRAKYIISTHGYFPGVRTARGQIHINLWHGMTFKKIGRLLEEEIHSNGKKDEADMTIATSPVFQKLMAQAFGLTEKEVFVTGQPCTDVLLEQHNALENLSINKKKYKKVIAWMPTYRKSIVGDIRSDGKAESFGVADMLHNHFMELDNTLKGNQYLLIVKLHPMDELLRQTFPESDNIHVLTNEKLVFHDVDLYELLGECDMLMTDYSSVFIDYLVTGKPLAFVCDDISEYGDSRGFCFNPPREYMPGELISNHTEFIGFLKNVDAINAQWAEKYKEIKGLFYPFSDDLSSKRVCDAINL